MEAPPRSPRSRRRDDRGEVVGIERGAADQSPVDLGPAEQLGGIGGLDRAAVLDPDPLPRTLVAGADQRADEAAGVVGLIGLAVLPVPIAQIGS